MSKPDWKSILFLGSSWKILNSTLHKCGSIVQKISVVYTTDLFPWTKVGPYGQVFGEVQLLLSPMLPPVDFWEHHLPYSACLSNYFSIFSSSCLILDIIHGTSEEFLADFAQIIFKNSSSPHQVFSADDKGLGYLGSVCHRECALGKKKKKKKVVLVKTAKDHFTLLYANEIGELKWKSLLIYHKECLCFKRSRPNTGKNLFACYLAI